MRNSLKPFAFLLGFLLIAATAAQAYVSGNGQTTVATTKTSHSGTVSGPDIYVGEIYETQRWGQANGKTAFSLGGIACNQGDTPVLWIDNTNEHPVIAQQMYRYQGGRFEQIGMSWVKHGFGALDQNYCDVCTPTGTTTLGPGCSDPYTAELNGFQLTLGPRSEINPYTGDFPFPHGGGFGFGTLHKRLQIDNNDLDPAQNPGAIYISEVHYVTADDAQAGNDLNNASYRPLQLNANGSTYTFQIVPTEPTRRYLPAIFAWQEIDPSVTIEQIVMPNDGVLYLGYKVTDNGDGTWDYEYALHNYNSDRAARGFAVPIPSGVNVTNIDFHDVDYHSGEPYSGADWSTKTILGHLVWFTQSHSSNPDANALRWGTLYNFRFTADSAPVSGNGVVGAFKQGSTNRVFVATQVPG